MRRTGEEGKGKGVCSSCHARLRPHTRLHAVLMQRLVQSSLSWRLPPSVAAVLHGCAAQHHLNMIRSLPRLSASSELRAALLCVRAWCLVPVLLAQLHQIRVVNASWRVPGAGSWALPDAPIRATCL
jgi:hypothetical protein